MAGHVTARVGTEEPRDRGDVELGVALAAHRAALDELPVALALGGGLAVMGRGGGRDHVHADPIRAPLACRGTRDRPDRFLRGVVRTEAPPADDAHRRREVDDAAPTLLAHVGVRRLHRPDGALHPGAVEDVEIGGGDGRHRCHRAEGLRVVHQAVKAPETLDRGGDHRLDLVLLVDVALHAEGGYAPLRQLIDSPSVSYTHLRAHETDSYLV